MVIWYELVRDKKSVFLRPYMGKASEAWKVLCMKFKSFEITRSQKLISDITNLDKYRNENTVDCVTRTEDRQLNLSKMISQ